MDLIARIDTADCDGAFPAPFLVWQGLNLLFLPFRPSSQGAKAKPCLGEEEEEEWRPTCNRSSCHCRQHASPPQGFGRLLLVCRAAPPPGRG